MSEGSHSRGLGRWLGRQFGFIRKAIHTPVEKKTIIRQTKVEEQTLPDQPHITARRTVTDELIIRQKKEDSSQ